ncbi:MerR family transcriptional regulator [Kribbella italica]|uniref:DNA-binding transcriptional MerR regulator n=1 Tax=Kribbella italica TaxID=1540520 RepID=A0A7W9J525_9ACTN|nr:DNA-binding transcriptional MerR regulator [Kribbella italica]
MVWSPRQLAELADTSRRTVRHYHELGLLPEPRRQSNGYRLYGVAHLIRLLRIRRLTQLGLTLPQIAVIGDADEHPATALRALDAELAVTIDQLQQTRLELADMLHRAAPTDLPAAAAAQVRGLPEVERALVVVLSRLLSDDALEAYLDLLAPYRDHTAVAAFDSLAVDADLQQQHELAARLAGHLRALSTDRSDLVRAVEVGLPTISPAKRTVQRAIGDLYHPAQLSVLTLTLEINGASPPSFE